MSTNNENNEKESGEGKHLTGAAVAGGVAGLLVGGPILAVAGGIGAAVAAQRNDNLGEAARATGGAVDAIGDRAKEIDHQHHILDKTKNFLGGAINNIKKFDEKHRIVEKTSKGIAGGADFVAKKVRESSAK